MLPFIYWVNIPGSALCVVKATQYQRRPDHMADPAQQTSKKMGEDFRFCVRPCSIGRVELAFKIRCSSTTQYEAIDCRVRSR